MKRIVLTFGLIAGAVLSVMMVVQSAFIDQIGFDRGEVIGYTTMVLAFLMVFFGIRSYRDQMAGGNIRFGKAFTVGILIALIASACYVLTWQLIYYQMAPDFVEKYAAHTLEKARKVGATQQELAAKAAEMARFRELYRNPFINAGITFVEVFPIGLVMTLVSAGILGRKRDAARTANLSRPGTLAG
jgi:ethanolamine transporter EutH